VTTGSAATGPGTADRIELRGLRVLARVGVLPFEQSQDQPVEIDVDLVADLRAAGASDDLADTIDYGAVCAAIEEDAVRAAPVALLERLAARVAEVALGLDDRITAVDVVVRKLRPPVAQHLATSGVRLHRERT
jgi:7,8-dihydroneopterin aldolase/epimerase/oxygenase